jgi:hypothetical protein
MGYQNDSWYVILHLLSSTRVVLNTINSGSMKNELKPFKPSMYSEALETRGLSHGVSRDTIFFKLDESPRNDDRHARINVFGILTALPSSSLLFEELEMGDASLTFKF